MNSPPRLHRREFLLASAAGLAGHGLGAQTRSIQSERAADAPEQRSGIFPFASQFSRQRGSFNLSNDVVILVPPEPTAQEWFLARSLRNELSDWFGIILTIERASDPTLDRRAIVMGISGRPLTRAFVAKAGVKADQQTMAPESYTLLVRPDLVVVAGADSAGAFYGFQSLRQLLASDEGKLTLPCVNVTDGPQKPFRGLKLYLPGQQNIPFFKRFVRDFVATHKYNTLIMELNAGMRLESHPELNAGWRDLVLDTNYSRRNYPPGSLHGREQNSCHQDTADGGFIEKREVAELADFVRSHGIELIPEMPSFTHSYYLLTRHKDLSEVPGERWPDTYCPSNPETYRLLFDVYDEYIDLLKPRTVHIGRDELFAPVGLCPRCGDRDIGDRYGEDVARVHAHLKKKDIRIAMWGDMLLESVRGKGLQERHAPDGWKYKVAGGMTRAQVDRFIPKDILIFNWFWNKAEGEWSEQQAENNEAVLDQMGFQQIFGNFSPVIENYPARSARRSLLGAAPSAWCATNEFNFGKIMLGDFLACSNIVWHGDLVNGRRLSALAQSRMPDIRSRFRGYLPPSRTESSMAPVDISGSFNTAGGEAVIECDLRGVRRGQIYLGRVPFELGVSGGKAAVAVATTSAKPMSLASAINGIRIGRDVSSVVFLHASAKPAGNREPDRLLWDVFDSADVLGWYEIVYEDAYTETIPIRYGVNIAEWDWQSRVSDRDYCYGADPLVVSERAPKPITMFAFEWENTRPGKVIAEVRLKGTAGFRGADPDYTNHYGPITADNAVILTAISVVNARAAAENA
ncbi:MAG: beta-N-acetylhexosaminidase [Acidobacteriia bacterium]|nr:beta-N-acetylhexosaminidase [Terriglobia bacterium]